MEKFRFFDSALGDTREYNADEFGEYFRTLINTGLVEGALNELAVTAGGTTMKSTINTGNVFIDGYWYENDSSLQLEHDVETVGNNRIDRVVIRLDKTVGNRFIKAFIVKGTAGVSPTAPTLTRNANIYELSLAQVYITGGQSFIAQANVTDERGDATLCPYADSNILPSYDAQALANLIDDFIAHVADSVKHITSSERNNWNGIGLNSYASVVDSGGIYTVLDYKRIDGTLYMKSTLSGGTSPSYTTNTWQFYDDLGTTVISTKTWTISYDAGGKITSKVVA